MNWNGTLWMVADTLPSTVMTYVRSLGTSGTTSGQVLPPETDDGEHQVELEMWANAQPDGRPAEYR